MYTISQLVRLSTNSSRALIIYLSTGQFEQTQSGKTLKRLFGRLGRDLDAAGGVVVSYPGSEDAVMNDLLRKPWTEEQVAALQHRPGILVIAKNFEDFDPQTDSFFHLSLSSLFNENGTLNEAEAMEFVMALHGIFLSDKDLFQALNDFEVGLRRRRAANAINIKPSFYGMEIDVRQFISAIRGRRN